MGCSAWKGVDILGLIGNEKYKWGSFTALLYFKFIHLQEENEDEIC